MHNKSWPATVIGINNYCAVVEAPTAPKHLQINHVSAYQCVKGLPTIGQTGTLRFVTGINYMLCEFVPN